MAKAEVTQWVRSGGSAVEARFQRNHVWKQSLNASPVSSHAPDEQ
ncbi:MAG TPA: hypothetical protein PKA03_12740 [Tabrizicola sp.]|nr:hypothetical protein [Tabrizicola sp.]